MKTCKNCKKWGTYRCNAYKQEGKHPGPNDSCYGWKRKEREVRV